MDERSLSHLGSRIRLACLKVSRRSRSATPTDVPAHFYAILTQLERGPLTAAQLAAKEAVSPPVMSRNLHALDQRGLIHRARDPLDGRRVMISLSALGRATYERVLTNRNEWVAGHLRMFTEEEQEILAQAASLLERIGR